MRYNPDSFKYDPEVHTWDLIQDRKPIFDYLTRLDPDFALSVHAQDPELLAQEPKLLTNLLENKAWKLSGLSQDSHYVNWIMPDWAAFALFKSEAWQDSPAGRRALSVGSFQSIGKNSHEISYPERIEAIADHVLTQSGNLLRWFILGYDFHIDTLDDKRTKSRFWFCKDATARKIIMSIFKDPRFSHVAFRDELAKSADYVNNAHLLPQQWLDYPNKMGMPLIFSAANYLTEHTVNAPIFNDKERLLANPKLIETLSTDTIWTQQPITSDDDILFSIGGKIVPAVARKKPELPVFLTEKAFSHGETERMVTLLGNTDWREKILSRPRVLQLALDAGFLKMKSLEKIAQKDQFDLVGHLCDVAAAGAIVLPEHFGDGVYVLTSQDVERMLDTLLAECLEIPSDSLLARIKILDATLNLVTSYSAALKKPDLLVCDDVAGKLKNISDELLRHVDLVGIAGAKSEGVSALCVEMVGKRDAKDMLDGMDLNDTPDVEPGPVY